GNQSLCGNSLTNVTNLNGVAVSSISVGNYWYGSGVDGGLTLVANTTLATNQDIRQYSSITLAGFTLTGYAAGFTVLMVSGTLSLGGGTIQSGDANGGGAGGITISRTGSPASTGGAGGNSRSALYVFANTITGTGTITAAGKNGGAASVNVT